MVSAKYPHIAALFETTVNGPDVKPKHKRKRISGTQLINKDEQTGLIASKNQS
ncbi:hypothetical protein [Mucilaginibacter segetis]|uniref:Uncharacterized protein n=1 Tax=Mucilaginibacter segetis TaxID=2793071 RepID=A0A934PS28_9SPHI|nr:hypothetical protein [Mucilaginibacter segetis]MBK0378586.1 hypothetical protein [Mucilaginibacter segetis]